MSWYPHATVAVVVERDGKFLLVEELSSGEVVFNQPAGHIDEGESIIHAAKREALEETGWQVEPDYIIGLYIYHSDNNDTTYHRTCFHAEAVSYDASLELDDGIIREVWMTREEIAAHSNKLRSPMVLQCIDDYLAGKQFPLDLICDYHH